MGAEMAIDHCPGGQELSRYQDGELPPDVRAEVAVHLAACAACRDVLAQLIEISRLFGASRNQQLSQIAKARLYRRMDAVLDGGFVRLAWTLSGLAASVLLIGSVWLMHAEDHAAPLAAAPPPWVGVAYASDIGQSQREPATPAAEWYLASSASTSDELP